MASPQAESVVESDKSVKSTRGVATTKQKVYYTIKKTGGFEDKHLVESKDGFEPNTIQCIEYGGLDPDKKYRWITESQLNG